MHPGERVRSVPLLHHKATLRLRKGFSQGPKALIASSRESQAGGGGGAVVGEPVLDAQLLDGAALAADSIEAVVATAN